VRSCGSAYCAWRCHSARRSLARNERSQWAGAWLGRMSPGDTPIRDLKPNLSRLEIVRAPVCRISTFSSRATRTRARIYTGSRARLTLAPSASLATLACLAAVSCRGLASKGGAAPDEGRSKPQRHRGAPSRGRHHQRKRSNLVRGGRRSCPHRATH
jgi:hypothetical protein